MVSARCSKIRKEGVIVGDIFNRHGAQEGEDTGAHYLGKERASAFSFSTG